ncbi:MAG TPA: AAA family ATPase [Ktedonobacterales bacterium]|nr:AAA family ATPase [Ktedonobacterales bacterium]
MAVELLERDPFLLTLNDLLVQAGEGRGRVALISGEAGIGKTSLVERFLEQHQAPTRTLWGACEALFTPRPLGPLYDIAPQLQTPLRALLDGDVNRATLFATVLDELTRHAAPTIVVIEDIHWADEATLDLVKFLARRIHRTPALLILTYRDDDLTKDHPLRLVLGDLPADNVTRVWLPPLSEIAVASLAQQAGRPVGNLHAATGGNSFFLKEVLASDLPGLPRSVRDAVLARIARLSYEAQCFLELASVVSAKLEWRTVEAMTVVDNAWLEECLASGILRLENGLVDFRHELARQAVESTLSPTRKRTLNAQVLRAFMELGEGQVALARLVHHASQAEDSAAVLQFAPAAAREASAQGAHREAVEQYRTALRFADGLEDEQRAGLLEGLARECLLIGQATDAIRAGEDAVALWRSLDIPQRVGYNLRWLSRIYWWVGQGTEAKRYADAAVSVLQTLPPDSELGWAYSYRAMLAMLAEETTDAQLWANRTVELAGQLGDEELLVHAYHTLEMTRLNADDQQEQTEAGQSLQLALEHNLIEHVGRAYANLSSYFVKIRDYARADRIIAAGIAYCTEHDFELFMPQLIAARAMAALDRGNWLAASEDANTVIDAQRASPVFTIHARAVLGLVRMRRGDPGVNSLLDEARDLALSTCELQRIAPTMAARAEAAWLRGNLAQCAAEARTGFDVARAHNNPWQLGQLAFWLWRAGALTQAPPGIAAPYALQMAGDWRAAADAWEAIGCPYEQALALMDGDEAAQRNALAIFERLGARPAAETLRRQLRTAGARGLPRGPRPATQANPYGLTNRQFEILLLLAEGLRNPEIADRLSTTPKTIEHHVSDVLAKLNVRSRAEAVRLAYQLGLVPQPTKPPTGKMGV